jgi:hypothetical protein
MCYFAARKFFDTYTYELFCIIFDTNYSSVSTYIHVTNHHSMVISQARKTAMKHSSLNKSIISTLVRCSSG